MIGAAMAWWGGALWLAAIGSPAGIEVRGDTSCPSAHELQAALVGMVSPGGAPATSNTVELSTEGSAVNLRLLKSSGEAIAEKRLPEARSCAERARAAAVIVAAWEVRFQGGAAPALRGVSRPAAQPPLPEQPRVAAVAEPTPTLARAPLPPHQTGGDVVVVTSQPAALSPAPLTLETGAAVCTSLVAKEIATGGAFELRFSRRDAPFAVGAGAFAVDTHTTPVGGGQGRWRRLGGIVDLRSIARWRRVEMEMRAGLALSALSVSGQAFPVTLGATLFDVGGIAGLRARFPLGRVAAWIDTTGAVWPSERNLFVTGTTSTGDIPTFEVFISVGVSLMLIR